MVNKDKTGGIRSRRLREERAKWLAKNAYGLSAEGLIGALMRGECSLSWQACQQSVQRTAERSAKAVKRGEMEAIIKREYEA